MANPFFICFLINILLYRQLEWLSRNKNWVFNSRTLNYKLDFDTYDYYLVSASFNDKVPFDFRGAIYKDTRETSSVTKESKGALVGINYMITEEGNLTTRLVDYLCDYTLLIGIKINQIAIEKQNEKDIAKLKILSIVLGC